jgi:hypothetical protein
MRDVQQKRFNNIAYGPDLYQCYNRIGATLPILQPLEFFRRICKPCFDIAIFICSQ